MNSTHHSVVVGVAPADYRLPLVLWAAAEAAVRDAELRLVTAVPMRAAPDLYLPAETADALREAGHSRLADAVERVRAHRPGLRVTTAVVSGAPADVLRTAGATADLLVVGTDDQSPFAETVSGSVPGSLLTTAPCPLAVVPHPEMSARDELPMVAALDEVDTSKAALAYAFAAADRSRRSLVVVHCLLAERKERASRPGQTLLLAAFRGLYPHVAVTEDIAPGDPRDVLAQWSRRAALMVLGSRGHGRLTSTLFGSVGRILIRRSGCPVVIARAGTGDLVEGAM